MSKEKKYCIDCAKFPYCEKTEFADYERCDEFIEEPDPEEPGKEKQDSNERK